MNIDSFRRGSGFVVRTVLCEDKAMLLNPDFMRLAGMHYDSSVTVEAPSATLSHRAYVGETVPFGSAAIPGVSSGQQCVLTVSEDPIPDCDTLTLSCQFTESFFARYIASSSNGQLVDRGSEFTVMRNHARVPVTVLSATPAPSAIRPTTRVRLAPPVPAPTQHEYIGATDLLDGRVRACHTARTPANAPCVVSRGALLHGPAGSGKTILAKKIAANAGCPLVIAGPETQSLAGMDVIFAQACAASPCVLFIDEVDSVSSDIATKIYDIASQPVNRRVFLLGATNRPDAVSPRLVDLLDVTVEVGVPSEVARHAILQSMVAQPHLCRAPTGLLLVGPAGSGKRRLVEAAAGVAGVDLTVLDGAACGTWVDPAATVRAFLAPRPAPPTVRLILHVDKLCPVRTPETAPEIIAATNSALQFIQGLVDPVVCTTSAPDSVDPALRRFGRVDREIVLPSMTVDDRVDVLTDLMSHLQFSGNPGEVAGKAMGFSRTDLEKVVKQSVTVDPTGSLTLPAPALDAALNRVTPVTKWSTFDLPKDITFDTIYGYKAVKQRLTEAALLPIQQAAAYRAMRLPPVRGLLVYGANGVGKTSVATAIANESGRTAFALRGPDILSPYLGETEKRLTALFKAARQAVPAVILIDELDALCPNRSDTTGTIGTRILTTLLTLIDGVDSGAGVMVIGTTSRPEAVDAALRRSGRLGVGVHVTMPQVDDLQAMLTGLLGSLIPSDPADRASTMAAIDGLAARAHAAGLSSGDVKGLCDAVKERVVFGQEGLAAVVGDIRVVSSVDKGLKDRCVKFTAEGG